MNRVARYSPLGSLISLLGFCWNLCPALRCSVPPVNWAGRGVFAVLFCLWEVNVSGGGPGVFSVSSGDS